MNKLKDRLMNNNLFKNSLTILCGQSAASIISFFATIISVRAIGLYGIGIITIVQSYSSVFNGIFNFQSYNAIIKFGSEALEKKDLNRYKQYLKQAVVQDLVTAFLAFFFGAISVNIVGSFMHWNSDVVFYAKIYLITILFNITGSVNGLLRLNNEFKPGAKIAVNNAIVRIIFLTLGLILKVDLIYYVLMEIGLTLLNNILFFISGYKCLKKQNCQDFFKVKIKFDKEFTAFNFYNNIVSTIDMPTGQLVNMIINKFLGFSEVGIYNIIVKLGSLLTRVTEPIIQALLPELSKHVAQGNSLKAHSIVIRIFKYILSFGGIALLGVTITYRIWLPIFMPATVNNLITLLLYLSYIFITSSIAGIHLLFVSLNLVKYNVPVTIICNSIYILLLYFLALGYGLNGIIIALIIQAIMIVLVKYRIIFRKGCLVNEA